MNRLVFKGALIAAVLFSVLVLTSRWERERVAPAEPSIDLGKKPTRFIAQRWGVRFISFYANEECALTEVRYEDGARWHYLNSESGKHREDPQQAEWFTWIARFEEVGACAPKEPAPPSPSGPTASPYREAIFL